jgi:predicted permease
MRTRFAAALHSQSRGSTASRSTQGLRHGFIVAQVALAFVLLTGAGLLGLSLKRAMSVLPGFRPDHVMTGQFNLTWKGYHDINSFYTFFDGLYDKTRALPGILAVGAISDVPMKASEEYDALTVVGYTPRPGETLLIHDEFGVAGDYFAAMGVPLREGRFILPRDARAEQLVCVVDENFAHHYWPEGGAVGKLLFRGTQLGKDEKGVIQIFNVVGVVGSVKQNSLTESAPRGSVYFPYSKLFHRDYYLVTRTSLAPEALALSLAKAVREVDPEIPLTDLRSMDARIYDSLATRRSPALMAAIFAFTALLLAAIGLYGVMAYAVVQRTREFGVRLALGAQRADVLRLVLGQGVRLAAIGLAAGLAASLLLTGFMSSLLFGLTASNPLAYAGVAAVLAAVAGLACLIPALRATRVDPNVALRCE